MHVNVRAHASSWIALLLLCVCVTLCRLHPVHGSAVRGEAGVAVLGTACDKERDALKNVICVLQSSERLLASHWTAHADNDDGQAADKSEGRIPQPRSEKRARALIVFPEAMSWRQALLAPAQTRRDALRQYAISSESLNLTLTCDVAMHFNHESPGFVLLNGMACLAKKFNVEVVFSMLTLHQCTSDSGCGIDGELLVRFEHELQIDMIF